MKQHNATADQHSLPSIPFPHRQRLERVHAGHAAAQQHSLLEHVSNHAAEAGSLVWPREHVPGGCKQLTPAAPAAEAAPQTQMQPQVQAGLHNATATVCPHQLQRACNSLPDVLARQGWFTVRTGTHHTPDTAALCWMRPTGCSAAGRPFITTCPGINTQACGARSHHLMLVWCGASAAPDGDAVRRRPEEVEQRAAQRRHMWLQLTLKVAHHHRQEVQGAHLQAARTRTTPCWQNQVCIK